MRLSGDRPRILVTVRKAAPGADAAILERTALSTRRYAEAVRLAGGDPIVVGAGDSLPAAYDGLLLSGGADIHPRYYGQEIDEAVGATITLDEARDALEIPLARRALEADLPMLCICRGIQTLNVAAGGTLWQDVSLIGVDPQAHNQDGRLESWEYGQQVVVDPDTMLSSMVGEGWLGVNTYHHQAVRDAARGFRVTARAPDGIVEGMESRQHRFIVGIQWHPERLVSHHPVHRALFARFVDAARQR
jgi:putative glutamine amidotransferase